MTHETDRQEKLDYLRKLLPPRTTVYTKVLHLTRSGLSKTIGLYAVTPDRQIVGISYEVAQVMGDKFDEKRGGIIMTGVGTDLSYEAVYRLSRALYPGDPKALRQENLW